MKSVCRCAGRGFEFCDCQEADTDKLASVAEHREAIRDLLALFDQGTNVAGTAERFARYQAAVERARKLV